MSQGRGSWRKRARIKKQLAAVERVCWLCLEPLDFTITDWRAPDYVVIDEVVPVSKGGNPLDVNCCHLVHNKCNGKKGARILERGALATKPKASQSKPKPSRNWSRVGGIAECYKENRTQETNS